MIIISYSAGVLDMATTKRSRSKRLPNGDEIDRIVYVQASFL